MMKPQYITYVLLFCTITTFTGACSNKMKDEAVTLMAHPISIPSELMDRRTCSQFRDSLTEDVLLRLVFYVDSLNCQTCRMSQFAQYERIKGRNDRMSGIEFIYIINSTPLNKEFLYAQLCNARIKGTVYLDTCNAFLQANPHVPENTLFHTFVLDEKDKVVLIGDPFKNKKMERLLLKVIEQESKHRETTETRL